MVTRAGKQRELSSTYQSFADTGPTYSYLDLTRARSDESLMWSAGEEAAALVAELRASLTSPLMRPSSEDKEDEGVVADQDVEEDDLEADLESMAMMSLGRSATLGRGVLMDYRGPFTRGTLERGSLRSSGDRASIARSSFCGRSLSFTDLHSAGTSAEDLRLFCFEPSRLHCTNHCPVSHHPSSPASSTASSRSATCGTGVSIIGNGGGGHHGMVPGCVKTPMKTFGGSWRSLLKLGGMSGRGKPAAAVKVSPPTVPDAALTHRHSGSSFSSGVYSAGDQRSSYSSSVSDDNPPPSPRSPARVNCDHGQLGRVGTNNPNNNNNNNNNNSSNNAANNNGQHGNNSPSHFHNQQFTFPNQGGVPQFAHLMCPKTSPGSPHHVPPDNTYNYLTYQQQTSLEDQGIDVQSPGRSSPGSGSGSSTTGSTASSGGCRNSTTSLDSGRASTSTHTHQHRLSGQSYDSGSILRHSYHSSSSSLGSMEHDGTPHVNVPELLNNGVRDSEVLRAWLTDIRSDEYYEKFILAGYDMPTISRMTPEDLNAIGITKPAHRKKLKAEITKLNISDRLPNFIPGRLEDWLQILRLEEYTTSLKQQGYTSVEQMTQLTWEDLEDIGITKLGHQKKVMLAIKRVKDIMAGKKFASVQDTRIQNQYGTHEIMISREAGDGREQFSAVPEFRTFAGPVHPNAGDLNRLTGPADPGGHYGVPNHYAPGVQFGPMGPPQAHVQPMPHQSGPYISSGQYGGPQGPSPPGGKVHNGPPHPLPGPGQVQYRPDVVAVQIRPGGRGRSAESLEEPIYGTYQTFHPDSRLSLAQGPSSLGSLPPRPFPPPSMMTSHPQRSMDDGDITPTNEYAGSYEGGGTLPRPRTANKLRPVAKVTAKTRVDVHEVPQFIKDGMNLKKPSQVEEVGMKDLNVKTLNRQNSEKISSSQGSGSTNNTPQGTPKKLPPPPPRRSNSISETSKEAACRDGQHGYLKRGLSYGYMGIKNNLQPDVTPDLPPPPAPPDSANHQHLPDDFPPPPPPLTCVTMASTSRITSTITTASITSDSLATSQTLTSASDEISPSFRPRRNDSNASFKSTSSTDSDSLPFANENAGTIKQRACRPHPGLSVLDTRNSPHSSPRSSPALRRKDAQIPLRQTSLTDTEQSSDCQGNPESGSPDGTGDVLNDIGNMLANLTDELDAMLEQELVLKN
ncbi:caskin-2-like isoform X1 [Palaemon carinicauda]|uniref:caskin-2-like isoform X1 n=1 Tax=Palaemon carinicauda TaxID=392227 RepID=UPI0035B6747D